MHRKLRAQGRVPGAEGRAQIAANRVIRAEQRRLATIAALSSVTVGEKGADGLTREQRAANEMKEALWAEEERQRVARVQAEFATRQKRLEAARFPC
jgi:hypothetical protein